MRLKKLSVEKGLEKIAAKLCGLNNRYILGINENDLNPEIPLSTDSEWRKNRGTGQAYAIFGLGMVGTTLATGFLTIKEVADMIYHFGDLGAMVKDFGAELSYVALLGTSIKLAKKSAENINNLQQKRKNKYNSPEPA